MLAGFAEISKGISSVSPVLRGTSCAGFKSQGNNNTESVASIPNIQRRHKLANRFKTTILEAEVMLHQKFGEN